MDQIKGEIINHDEYSDFLVKTRDSFYPDSSTQLQDDGRNLKSEITLQEIKVEKLDIERQFTDENESLYDNIIDRETERCIPNDWMKEEEIQPQEFNTLGYSETNSNQTIETNSKEHSNIVEKDGSLFKCKLCGFKAVREYYIKFHYERMHLKQKFKNFRCDLCDYSATQRYLVRTHKSAVHPNASLFKCDLCDYTSPRKENVSKHKVKHSTIRYKCPLCVHTTCRKKSIQVHIDRVHLNLKENKCYLCEYSTYQKHILKFHIDAVHLKVKQHKCNFCNHATYLKHRLKKHIQAVHFKQKSYTCKLCHFVAADNSKLRSHINWVHVNDRNYKCTLCDYAGYLSSNLKLHMKRQHPEFKK